MLKSRDISICRGDSQSLLNLIIIELPCAYHFHGQNATNDPPRAVSRYRAPPPLPLPLHCRVTVSLPPCFRPLFHNFLLPFDKLSSRLRARMVNGIVRYRTFPRFIVAYFSYVFSFTTFAYVIRKYFPCFSLIARKTTVLFEENGNDL